MTAIKSSSELASRLAFVEEAAAKGPQLPHLEQNVGLLLKDWPREQGIYAQLKRLAEFIEVTKSEIAALKPVEVNTSFIPTATDELDAIVEATAAATNRIMDAAEVLTQVTESLPAAEADSVMGAVTSIYEACTFQDITGQRITKVIKTLKVIQQRLDQMIDAAGTDLLGDKPPSRQGDAALLNGPALPGSGKNQDEIDALLASFD